MTRKNSTGLQLQPQLDFGPVEHCSSFHHQNQSGVAFTQLHHTSGEWDALGTYQFEEAMEFAWGVMPEELNIYMTVNGIRPFARRCVEHVTHLNAFFLDLDFYNVGLSFESMLHEVRELCEQHGLELPTYVVNSGRGAYLIWLFHRAVYCGVKDTDKKNIEHWYNSQGTLIDMFKSVGADPKCRDASRVLRLAGTVNSKSQSPVRFFSWGTTVQFRTATRAISRYYLAQKQEQHERYQQGQVSKSKKRCSGAVVHLHTARSLMFARMDDLQTLASLRGGKLDDHREMTIFYYAISASVFYASMEGLLESVAHFIETCIKQGGKYDAKNPAKLLTSVINKHLDKEKLREAGEDYSQIQYRALNATIIRNLEITDEEQQHLKTIISAEEKQRRNTEAKKKKRRASGVVGRAEYEKDRKEELRKSIDRAVKLKASGLKAKAIAVELGVSVHTVYSWFKN
ncbi:helix-turn-helix domain-containing protein [Vibrio breoganii]